MDGLETIEWTESLKESQRYWIGKSEGTSIKFRLIPYPSPNEKGVQPEISSSDKETISQEPNWKTAYPKAYSLLKQYARENRQPLTESEDILWHALNC